MSAPQHLMEAAARKKAAAEKRVENAIRQAVKQQRKISVAGIARDAEVSSDFIYGHAVLRSRVERLRKLPAPARSVTETDMSAETSNVVRALSEQLALEKRERREESATLRQALAAAHSELYSLRRLLQHHESQPSSDGAKSETAEGA